MSRSRSSRASAVRARSLFKELDNEADEEAVVTVVKKERGRKRKRRESEDADQEFDVSGHVTEDSEEDEDDVGDENVSFEELDGESSDEEDGDEEETIRMPVMDSNILDKMRKRLLELWSDFVELPEPELREIPEEMRLKFLSKDKKRNNKSKKKVRCPIDGCNKQFSSGLGLVYHYKRCGIPPPAFSHKCKVCAETFDAQLKILYHLKETHPNDLPEVPEELQCLLPDRQTRKKSDKRCRQEQENFCESTQKYRTKHEVSDLFPDRMPLKSEWKALTTTQSEAYLPQSEHSCKFKSGDNNWRTLQRFESFTENCNKTFFTGGVVFSAAWVPTPTSCDADQQVLALNVGLNFDDSHAYSDNETEFSLIEFWSFGKLNLSKDDSDDLNPEMAFAVAYADGVVWEMVWCPFGNSWMPSDRRVDNKFYPRMGLLCVASGNGVIKILSIPHIQFLADSKRGSPPIFMPSPVIILDPPGVGPLTSYEPSICRCVAWNPTGGNRFIAAGFGSGVVSVWNIESKSRFIKSKESSEKCEIFLPNWSFPAHGSSVNAVRWYPDSGSMILASGSSLERELSFWDLSDIKFPRRTGWRKGIITSIEWPFRWPGVFMGQDAAFCNLNASVMFLDPVASRNNRLTTTANTHRSTVWSVSYNEWTNTVASGDASGHVVAFRNFDPHRDRNRGTFEYRIPIYRIECTPLSEGEEVTDVFRTYECMSQNFGLKFHDIDLSDVNKIDNGELKRIKKYENMGWEHPSAYPLLSVNRVAWNPNKGSYTWLFTAGQNGICRISCLSLLKQ